MWIGCRIGTDLKQWNYIQSISVAWWSRHLLRRTIWERNTLENRIPIWCYKGSSVCRKHYEPSWMSILGSLPIYSSVDTGLSVHDTFGIEWRSKYSCQAARLISLQVTIDIGQEMVFLLFVVVSLRLCFW